MSGAPRPQTTNPVPHSPLRRDQTPASAGNRHDAGRRPWYGRIPWTPVAISLAVILSSGFAVRPVRNAATLAEISEAFLARPVGYVAIAPVSNLLDTITLISERQHIALVSGVLVLFALARLWVARRGGVRPLAHVFAVASLFVGILAVYAAAVFMPRPMAFLASHDANILRVDFHSHTASSGDTRRGFTVERNRAWHRAGGYDVAYITDHGSVEGAERGIANNPLVGFDSVVLLQAIEVTWTGEHVAILGAQRTYRGLLTENLRDVDPQGLDLGSAVGSREPVVIWNHPRDINRLPPAAGPTTAGVRAIEISNGSPDGKEQIRSKRAQLVALAERHNLALTTGSDNHGWGHAAPNWTLMRPVNWRGITGDEVALRIERVIRDAGFGATRVVERVVADPGTSRAALALSIVTVPWGMLTTLSTDERLMWLLWTWVIAGAVWWIRRRRRAV
jgi:hypothetical protein